jgi:hypothetical protein
MNHGDMPVHDGCVGGDDHPLNSYCETQLDLALGVWVAACNQRAVLIQELTQKAIDAETKMERFRSMVARLGYLHREAGACAADCEVCSIVASAAGSP